MDSGSTYPIRGPHLRYLASRVRACSHSSSCDHLLDGRFWYISSFRGGCVCCVPSNCGHGASTSRSSLVQTPGSRLGKFGVGICRARNDTVAVPSLKIWGENAFTFQNNGETLNRGL